MRALALAALLLPLAALAEDPPQSSWTGAGAVMAGEIDAHGFSLDGYLELGHRLNDDLTLLALGVGEATVSSYYQRDLASGGLGLRVTGDRLGGLAAPIEMTLGAGAGALVQGAASLGTGPYFMAIMDLTFPLTRRLRIHWNLVGHLNSQAFLVTTCVGGGVTFE